MKMKIIYLALYAFIFLMLYFDLWVIIVTGRGCYTSVVTFFAPLNLLSNNISFLPNNTKLLTG